jgi:hypothetical protein
VAVVEVDLVTAAVAARAAWFMPRILQLTQLKPQQSQSVLVVQALLHLQLPTLESMEIVDLQHKLLSDQMA